MTPIEMRAALRAGQAVMVSPSVRSQLIEEDRDDLDRALTAFQELLNHTEGSTR